MKRQKKGSFIWISMAIILFTTPVFADVPLVDDEMLITAHAIKKTISQTPGGTAILEGKELESLAPISITNALPRIAGVDKSSDSAWGSAINIRGLGRNRVVFLIDGTRVNTATDINAQFGLIDTSNIERIEILKGPVSALYGSGSIGGVVNVITKGREKPKKPGVSGDTILGWASNPQGYSTSAGVTASGKKGWLSVFGSHRDFDDTDDGNGDTIENSQFRDLGIHIKSGYQWNADHTTRFQYQRQEGEEIGIPGKGLALPVGPTVTYPDTY
ncbi:MAG: TonB-dependent receptor plug domain-containing protein, partial [Desulfobacterales bacterium]|nr:TonB-dependent receptor plug domain-containing protein [Desulfobacterales bacterium]